MTMEMAQPRFVGATKRGGNHGCHTKERAVRQAGGEPGDQHARVIGGDERGEVGNAEEQHEPQREELARQFRSDGGKHGSSDDDAQGVGRDQVAGLGSADPESGFDLLEQPHHGEFGDTDAEPAHGQGQDGGSDVGGRFGRTGGLDSGSHVPAFRRGVAE
jgi:hypothetical protein